jgi:asparagine synthase (glutamine-hydrolysing)
MMCDNIVDCLALNAPGPNESDPVLERNDVERVYTLLRLRYWMGRNNSIAARYGSFLTPLVSPRLVALAATLPLRWKTFGRFESAVIASLSPRVASGPSSYGFEFARGPSMAHRFNVCSTLLRPLALRQRSARIRRLLGRAKPPVASAEWVQASAGVAQQDWVVADALTTDDQLNRLLTLGAVVAGAGRG